MGRTKDMPLEEQSGRQGSIVDGKTIKGDVPTLVKQRAKELAYAIEAVVDVRDKVKEARENLASAMVKNATIAASYKTETKKYAFDLESLSKLKIKVSALA